MEKLHFAPYQEQNHRRYRNAYQRFCLPCGWAVYCSRPLTEEEYQYFCSNINNPNAYGFIDHKSPQTIELKMLSAEETAHRLNLIIDDLFELGDLDLERATKLAHSFVCGGGLDHILH